MIIFTLCKYVVTKVQDKHCEDKTKFEQLLCNSCIILKDTIRSSQTYSFKVTEMSKFEEYLQSVL